MYLAFLHGESIVFGFLLVAVVFWPTALALCIWKRRSLGQYRRPIIAAYLLLVAISSAALLSYDSDFFGFIFGTALTLPWSLFVPSMFGVVQNWAVAGWLFLCGLLNAGLFYVAISLLIRRRAQN
jgi:hypothetical protein